MPSSDYITRLKQYAYGETEELPDEEKPFGMLCRALCIWRSYLRWVYLTSRDVPPEEHQRSVPGADEIDIALAELVRRNPGVLEKELASEENLSILQEIRTLASPDSSFKGDEELFSILLSSMHPQEGELLWRTCRAMNDVDTFRLFIGSYIRYCHSNSQLSNHIYFGIQFYLTYLGPRRTKELIPSLPTITRSMHDILVGGSAIIRSRYRTPVPPLPSLPDILPADAELLTWSPERITRELAEYRELSPDDYHQFLVQNKFLSSGEVIGEVIARDVQKLADAGVTRHQLADALNDVTLISEAKSLYLSPQARERGITFDYSAEQLRDIDLLQERLHHLFGARMNAETGEWEGNTPPFQVQGMSTFGYHSEPFHSTDPLTTSRETGGTGDFFVTNTLTGEKIGFGNMLPYLIRRACFFEGNVSYRLDPAKACRVLSLFSVLNDEECFMVLAKFALRPENLPHAPVPRCS